MSNLTRRSFHRRLLGSFAGVGLNSVFGGRANSFAAPAPTPENWKASGKRGAVCAGGQAAVDAGITLLKAGGNAADAAVATILALSVTDNTAFCFGGEVPILIYN